MATRSYTVPLFGAPGKLFETYSNTSFNSPKVNGKIKLQTNVHNFYHARVTRFTNVDPNNAFTCQGAESNPLFPFTSDMDNEVYAKFVGKLRRGSGSLGVSIASWGQSRRMIVDRLEKISRIFTQTQRTRRLLRRSSRGFMQRRASDFLEGEFGWVPLLGDIFAIAESICGSAIPRDWVKATSRFNSADSVQVNGNPKTFTTYTRRGRITCAAAVDISNPNLWLLNRCGLINPAVVAWDLVPWSFVVNMFVNVNQILSSFTDTVGLTLSNGSTTRSYSVLMEQRYETSLSFPVGLKLNNFSNVASRGRNRVAGTIPRPSLQFRLPSVNFELMAIASALLSQQVGRMR